MLNAFALKSHARFLALSVLFACLTAAAPRLVAAGLPIVKSISIEGNKKIETAAIKTRIHLQIGDDLAQEKISADIKSLYGMGYFDQIEVDAQPQDGGVHVVFRVREKPVIIALKYEGLDAIDKDDLKDLILVKEYEVLDINKLNQSVDKLTAKYEEKGYYLAEVRYEIQLNEAKNEATVTFKIDEHDKIQVKRVNIIGNTVVPTSDLKGVMQTKEGDPFSWLTGNGSYREAVFDRDVAALGFYYGTLGYVRARFGKPEVTVSPDKKWIYITFSVEEGNQYRVGKIDFSGDLLYTRQELMDELELVPGEVFNTDTLRRETLKYTDKYADLGYAFANVVPQPNIHDDIRTVDVTFDVDKGERVYIGKITISGNTRTKDKVIRRELRIHEGELFNGTKKRESRDNVMRLGFFDTAEFHQSTSKQYPNVVDIDIKVKERSTGQLVIGAGYASGQIGFTAQAQLSQNNFLGNGQIASLSAQILTGQQYYDFNLGFQEPYIGYSYWSGGGDLYQLRRDLYTLPQIATFSETKTGFDLKVGHPVLEYTRLFMTYRFENSWVPPSSIVDTTIIPPSSVNGILSSLAGTVQFDKRDDRYDAHHGYFWELSSEYAGLGGNRKFIKSKAAFKYFHPIVWDFVFRFNFLGGNIAQVGDTRVPVNELFIQGGIFDLRGYDYFTVGPTQPLRNPSAAAVAAGAPPAGSANPWNIVVGGHNQLLANAEIEFPILKEARLRGVFFFDAGNAFDGFFSNQSPSLYADFGYGFRWFTPIGPLRFEFGYPIVPRLGAPKFIFTIGPPF